MMTPMQRRMTAPRNTYEVVIPGRWAMASWGSERTGMVEMKYFGSMTTAGLWYKDGREVVHGGGGRN